MKYPGVLARGKYLARGAVLFAALSSCVLSLGSSSLLSEGKDSHTGDRDPAETAATEPRPDSTEVAVVADQIPEKAPVVWRFEPSEKPFTAEFAASEGGDRPGKPIPAFKGDFFTGSNKCVICHLENGDAAFKYEETWRPTMLAQAFQDPYFRATVQSEVLSAPHLRSVIEDKCARCHAPMASVTLAARGRSAALLDTGLFDPEHPLHNEAREGVSCMVCHQIRPDLLGDSRSFSGAFVIDTTVQMGDRLVFGPNDNDPARTRMMKNMTKFDAVRGDHIRSSELCATCHVLHTAAIDESGKIVGKLPEQAVYLEWKASEFNGKTTCQDCHMQNIDTDDGRIRRRHTFVGGNAYMLRIYDRFGDELGLFAGSVQLRRQLALTMENLQERTGRVKIEQSEIRGGKLLATIMVENRTGHKFPTGYPSRRAWLRVTATDEGGRIIFQSGGFDRRGMIYGNDNDFDPFGYEPHYEKIRNPNEVQIYESIMKTAEGAVTTSLLRGASYIKDNRLLPRGMKKGDANSDIAARGAAFEDDNFTAGTDHIVYEIALPKNSGPVSLTAELMYQSIGFRWAMNLGEFRREPLVARFLHYYDQVPNLPVRVGYESVKVETLSALPAI